VIEIVPAKRMCDDGGDTLPSGTYAITGATSAFRSAAAMRPHKTFARTLCLPSTMCGPFCSVPPIGINTVVWPLRTSACTSGDVRSSRNTLCAWSAVAKTATAHATRNRAGRRNMPAMVGDVRA
jgi:hypothetical protein